MGGSWAAEDVLPLNGTPQEVQALREQVMQQRAAIRAKKDRKKGAKISAAAVEAAIAGAAADAVPNGAPASPNGVMQTHLRDAFLCHRHLSGCQCEAGDLQSAKAGGR